jgi:hypothetical protein
MKGIKHLIQCRCILPTLKNRKNPPLHKFIAFSILEDDKVQNKIVSCNNCGVNHLINDMCSSEFLSSETTAASLTLEDIKVMIPDGVVSMLETYEKDLPDYEHINFMMVHEQVNDFLVLTSESTDEKKVGKILRYKGENKFIIEPYSTTEIIS